ncbi:hypothetical protein N656DRAFT_798390 [Canariomyces notabilis]|uniref:Uncharacterized protein n=1 Tax=Canariomyces notabilis TaxID=2074819 RepID=A0AAN6TDW3_9PEZI|nr:hypothetical protein N656DRAFT_798390 [Canariomyces arenarius]
MQPEISGTPPNRILITITTGVNGEASLTSTETSESDISAAASAAQGGGSTSSLLSTGAVAGIAGGCVLVGLGIALGLLVLLKNRKRAGQVGKDSVNQSDGDGEISLKSPAKPTAKAAATELAGNSAANDAPQEQHVSWDFSIQGVELPEDLQVQELPGDSWGLGRNYELEEKYSRESLWWW